MNKYLIFVYLLFISIYVQAGKPVLIGNLNMISTRNFEASANYTLLERGTNDSKKAFKDLKAKSIDAAVNNAVLNVPGGEYLVNVKIYFDGKFYAAVGDVWGLANNQQIEGFAVGDVVLLENAGLINKVVNEKFTEVTITGLKDRKTCLVELPGGEIKEVNYSNLSRK